MCPTCAKVVKAICIRCLETLVSQMDTSRNCWSCHRRTTNTVPAPWPSTRFRNSNLKESSYAMKLLAPLMAIALCGANGYRLRPPRPRNHDCRDPRRTIDPRSGQELPEDTRPGKPLAQPPGRHEQYKKGNGRCKVYEIV